MSEIYPVEDWSWRTTASATRSAPLVRLDELSEAECAALLEDLQTMNLSEERRCGNLGLAIPVGTAWKQLRIGELKTLLALAIGDEEAILEGCDWLHHFNDLSADRALVYRCVESILQLENTGDFQRR